MLSSKFGIGSLSNLTNQVPNQPAAKVSTTAPLEQLIYPCGLLKPDRDVKRSRIVA